MLSDIKAEVLSFVKSRLRRRGIDVETQLRLSRMASRELELVARVSTLEAGLAKVPRDDKDGRIAELEADRLHQIDRYLRLLRDVLIGVIARDAAQPMLKVSEMAARSNGGGVEPVAFDPAARELGRDWPLTALSMIGTRRMDNLRWVCEMAIRDGIAGDFVETGVWRGGSCIFMRAVLQAHGAADRDVWVCDSFEGLPPPDASQFPADTGLMLNEYAGLAISLDEVQENFRRFGLLDERVHFVKGWFKDTLHKAPIERIAVLRLDGDLYQSTIEALEALYPKVSSGGYVVVDDYGAFDACKQAVHDYLGAHERGEVTITDIDGIGAWFRKP